MLRIMLISSRKLIPDDDTIRKSLVSDSVMIKLIPDDECVCVIKYDVFPVLKDIMTLN